MELREMLENVRANLVANWGKAASRGRHFHTHLVDPRSVNEHDLRAFHEQFDRVGHVLSLATRCFLVLPTLPPPRGGTAASATAEHGAVDRVYEAYLDELAQRDEFGASAAQNLREEIARTGATPGEWLRTLTAYSNGRVELRLDSDVVANEKLWWWLLSTYSGVQPVLLTSLSAIERARLYQWTFDPFLVGGGEGRVGWKESLELAKAQTARSEEAALIILPMNMYLVTVATGAVADRLFRAAVQDATITERLWARM